MTVARVLRDIVYSEVLGFRPLTLDLHLPESPSDAKRAAASLPARVAGSSRVPVILFVHGGGWRTGSKAVFTPTISAEDSFDRIVAAGFAVVAPDYRLSGEAHFPAQIDDVRAALEWIRANADEYDLDVSRIIVWGESAGASIGALVALEPASGVAAVIDWYGPANLVSMAERGTPEEAAASRETEWLGVSALEDPDLARAASAVFAVHEAAPPFYIAHGTADRFVPFSQSEELVAALTRRGVGVVFEPVDGANHMWRDIADPAALVGPALSFALGIAGLTDAAND